MINISTRQCHLNKFTIYFWFIYNQSRSSFSIYLSAIFLKQWNIIDYFTCRYNKNERNHSFYVYIKNRNHFFNWYCIYLCRCSMHPLGVIESIINCFSVKNRHQIFQIKNKFGFPFPYRKIYWSITINYQIRFQ